MLLYRTVKKLPGRAAPVLRFFICIPAVFGIICGRFVWLGGMNYSSLSFKELAEYDTVNTDTAVLKKLCAYLGKKASEARNQLDTDDSGAVYSRCSVPEILSVSQTGYEDLKEIYPFFDMYTVSPKPALFSEIMCYEQISGIFPIVYTESLVNAKTPVAELPHTACHELAHQYGFMQEDEANFIGYLACINSDDVLYIYSGYYTAFRYAMSQLYSYDKDAWQEIAEAVDPGIYTDISKGNSFWSSYEDKAEVIAAVSESVNNAYLQANNISDGTHSYGRMVDLLIAEYRGIL